ncbi:MAG: formate/nitrite family transporter [Candidatus Desantisbacteria bacterium]
MSSEFQTDSYSPKEMAERVENVGITKGNLDFWSTLALSILAGVFIGFGAMFSTFVIHDSSLTVGFTRLIGGFTFCLGLILVIVAGAELFTGNTLIVMAFVSKKTTLGKLLRNWGIVFIGNLIGSLLLILLVFLSDHWAMNDYKVGVKALQIAIDKVNLSFMVAFIRGILCNIIVCLAVWLCFSCRNTVDKIMAIIFPITAFATLGFEHSVANMFFIPAGLFLKSTAAVQKLANPAAIDSLTWGSFLIKNLLPVTLGNIVGGSVIIGVVYWFIYLRRDAQEPVRKIMTNGPTRVIPETTVQKALDIMGEKKQSSILVGTEQEAIGIVSEADIIRKVMVQHKDAEKVLITEIMSSPLISVDVKTPIYAIYQIMSNKGIRHILITEAGKQIGFVSVKDFLRKG